MKQYLACTKMLDYTDHRIQALIAERKWQQLDAYHKILGVYNFIRDEILFGYNVDDTITASKVLADGYGQCNTKGTLFMAILRALDMPCRMHGFTINKELQKGTMTGIVYALAPQEVVHTWVEVYYEGEWYDMEGIIVDKKYLLRLQEKFPKCEGNFCGYGVAVERFKTLMIDWNVNHTYIQKEGIKQDFGIYDNPDTFFSQHMQQLGMVKKFIYIHFGRHLMNDKVAKIRRGE